MRQTKLLLILLAVIHARAQVQPAQSTPAQDRIAFATKQIAANPAKSNLYVELATALLRRERETSDKSLFDQVQSAIEKSLELAKDNVEAQKTQVAILLGRHEYKEALVLAQAINTRVPDDVMTYGYIADADLAVGDYSAAEKAAQWMLDLRTHNLPGLIRGAELRQIFGDTEGALQFLDDAYQETSPDQNEDIAWLLTRISEVHLSAGKIDLADQFVQKALISFPDYYYSLEVQAQVRSAQNKFLEAADLLHKRNQHFPNAPSIYKEAEAVERAGKTVNAQTLFVSFEQLARSLMNLPDNDNVDLVGYYISEKRDPSEALHIASLEAERRHDVWTLDAYAQSLFAAGKYVDAEAQMERAMAPGFRDPRILDHASRISAALKNSNASEHGKRTR